MVIIKIKKYDEIINDLMADIHSGVLKPREKLPTNNELAQKYNTSGVTVRKSIAALITKGYLESVKRIGTFVKEREKEIYLLNFSPYLSINEEITKISTESINLTLIKMHHSKKDYKAVETRQIYFSDSIPICYTIDALLINGQYNSNHIVELTENQQTVIKKITNGFEVKKILEITMEMPNKYIQNKLLVDNDTPIFCFTIYYYTLNDSPVGKSVYYISGENIELKGKSFFA